MRQKVRCLMVLASWLMVAGVFLGFALGMYIVIKEAKRMERAEAPQKDDKKDGSI